MKAAYNNWEVPNKIIVTTEKDAARLHLHMDKLRAWDITIAVLPIKVDILFNKGEQLDNTIITYTERVIAENNDMFGDGGTVEYLG